MKMTLKEFIEKNNLNINDVSTKTGTSVNVLNRIMRGTYTPSPKTKEAFLEHYDLEIVLVDNQTNTKEIKTCETKENKPVIVPVEKTVTKTEVTKAGASRNKYLENHNKIMKIYNVLETLEKITNADPELFTKPEYVKLFEEISKPAETLCSIIKGKKIEVKNEKNDDDFLTSCDNEKYSEESRYFMSSVYDDGNYDEQIPMMNETVEEEENEEVEEYDDFLDEELNSISQEKNDETEDFSSYENDLLDDNSPELDYDDYDVLDDSTETDNEDNFEEFLGEDDYDDSFFDEFE